MLDENGVWDCIIIFCLSCSGLGAFQSVRGLFPSFLKTDYPVGGRLSPSLLELCIVLLFLLSELHWWGVIATFVQHRKKWFFCHLAMVEHFIPNPSIIIRWISRILQLLGRFRGLLSSQSIHCMHGGSMSSNITENYLGRNDLWSFTMHMVTNCVFIEGLCKQVQNALKLTDQNLQRLPVGKCSNTMNLQLQRLVFWTKLNGKCNIQQFYEFQYDCFLTELNVGCSTLLFQNNFSVVWT